MTQLSPQAQAIMDSWWNHSGNNQTGIAAVLRVLADNVAPEKYNSFTPGNSGFDKGRRQKNDCIREAILNIAIELEQI